MIGKESGQREMEAWGIQQKPGVLDEIDQAIDWRRFGKHLRKAYKDSDSGRPSYPPLQLFKVLLLQQWYGLSDPMAEEAISDRLSFRRFLGIDLHDAIPDETTICRFRGRLVERRLTERLFRELNRQLDAKGLLVKRGTLVDASLVEAQTRPPRKDDPEPPRDPDADWTVKNNEPTYGYKLHVGVDEGSGLVRQATLTPASTHDSRVFEELLSGDESAVYADKAYDDRSRRQKLKEADILDGILKQARRNRPLTDWERTWNRYLSRMRAPVERIFGTLKEGYRFRRARYRGLPRNHCHALLILMAFNMRKAVRLPGTS